jgi:hypothetical protein
MKPQGPIYAVNFKNWGENLVMSDLDAYMSSHGGPLEDTFSPGLEDKYGLEFLFIALHFVLVIIPSCKCTKVSALF